MRSKKRDKTMLGLVWLADEPLTPITQKFIDYVCTDFNVNSGLEG